LNCAEAEETKRRTVVRREKRMRAILLCRCSLRFSFAGLGSQRIGKALTKERKASNFKEWEVVAEIKGVVER
jgi:hypothetical protein